jgi:hypothetical protein
MVWSRQDERRNDTQFANLVLYASPPWLWAGWCSSGAGESGEKVKSGQLSVNLPTTDH